MGAPRARSQLLQQALRIDLASVRGLYARIGAGRISRFIEALVRPHVLTKEMDDAHAALSPDGARETEAMEWSEGLALRTAT